MLTDQIGGIRLRLFSIMIVVAAILMACAVAQSYATLRRSAVPMPTPHASPVHLIYFR
jgi:hypothetical protein